MTQPAVIMNELDGSLGVLPASVGDVLAVVGPSSAGTVDTPATYAKVSDITAAFGYGPLVEAACHVVERYGKPVLMSRCAAATTQGAYGTVTKTGTGSSIVTTDNTVKPYDDYQAYLVIVAGGTVGTAGITLQWSLDGGQTLSPVTALGTATNFSIPNANVKFLFAAGTFVAGDTVACTTTAPAPTSTELGSSLDALSNSGVLWHICEIATPVDSTLCAAIDTKFAGYAAVGKFKAWIGNVRMPTDGETEAAYLSSLTTALAAASSKYGELCGGAIGMTSSVSARKYRRPLSYVVAAREFSVSEEINIADVDLGPLPGTTVRDNLGNPKYHDESANPGLDDIRLTVARTWQGRTGVYVNRARCFSPLGSDFSLFTRRRVMNLFDRTLRDALIRRLAKPIAVSRTTGFILESEALEIESFVLAELRAAMLAKPKASDVSFTLSRTDNLLSTSTLTYQSRVIPLGYPEWITGDVGFTNPALQTVAVG